MHPIKEEVGKKLVIQTADRTVQIKADINNYYKIIVQYKIGIYYLLSGSTKNCEIINDLKLPY